MDKKKLKFNIKLLIVWLLFGFLGTYWLATIPNKTQLLTNGQAMSLTCFGPLTLAAAGCVAITIAIIEHEDTWFDQPFLDHPNNQRIPDAEDMDNK